jgi:four helix bundle protein
MAKRLDELPLYPKVLEFWNATTAILKRPALSKNCDLYGQIEDANDSIEANRKEGFEQPTDASFAQFVFVAKGSTAEVLARMRQAHRKHLIADADLLEIERLAEPLCKMMGGFIKYLRASGFTDRGRHGVGPSPRRPTLPKRR